MSELNEAIQEMRNMRQAYDQIGAAAEAYNTGKTVLAQNITAKGVPASESETIPELAQKVSAISQQPIILSPSEVGDMYAKQLYGSLSTPNYWNLYEVLVQLLNDGRLMNYGGILLAEYYKGYDSITVQNADAFVFSDIDGQGQFEMYDESISTTHVWHDSENGKGNRWVAYCFVNENTNFSITDTNTSPRSVFIGRKVGSIICNVNTRISKIVVPDGNSLISLVSGTFSHNFDKNIVLRNIKNVTNMSLLHQPSADSIFVDADAISSDGLITAATAFQTNAVIVKCNNAQTFTLFRTTNSPSAFSNLCYVGIEAIGNIAFTTYNSQYQFTSLKIIELCNAEDLILYNGISTPAGLENSIIIINYLNNDKSKTVSILKDRIINGWSRIKDLILRDGWCKPLNVYDCIGLVEDGTTNNITEHILKRLKQDEAGCGSGLTITLGSYNLAKLTSAESVQLLDDLTNIYGYTFA